MDDSSLGFAFVGVLVAFTVSLVALRRAGTRRQVALAGLTPLVAFIGYEALVGRVMPAADIRLDWMLLLPIALAHGLHAMARWRHLAPGGLD